MLKLQVYRRGKRGELMDYITHRSFMPHWGRFPFDAEVQKKWIDGSNTRGDKKRDPEGLARSCGFCQVDGLAFRVTIC